MGFALKRLSEGPVLDVDVLVLQFKDMGAENACDDWDADAEYRDDGYGTVPRVDAIASNYASLIEQECRECRVTDSHDIHALTEAFIIGYMAEWNRLSSK